MGQSAPCFLFEFFCIAHIQVGQHGHGVSMAMLAMLTMLAILDIVKPLILFIPVSILLLKQLLLFAVTYFFLDSYKH